MIRNILAIAAVTAVLVAGCGYAAAALPATMPTVGSEVPKYEREAFGDGWADLDGDCQNTRNEILIRDLVDEVLDGRGCTVVTGVLHDAYTGTVISFRKGQTTSDDVQIDHVVPLAYAWYAGAWAWTDEQREAFANDPAELLAVDGPTNNQKGADGPSSWLPPNPGAWCGYAANWSATLTRYQLQADPVDVETLAEVEASCPR